MSKIETTCDICGVKKTQEQTTERHRHSISHGNEWLSEWAHLVFTFAKYDVCPLCQGKVEGCIIKLKAEGVNP